MPQVRVFRPSVLELERRDVPAVELPQIDAPQVPSAPDVGLTAEGGNAVATSGYRYTSGDHQVHLLYRTSVSYTAVRAAADQSLVSISGSRSYFWSYDEYLGGTLVSHKQKGDTDGLSTEYGAWSEQAVAQVTTGPAYDASVYPLPDGLWDSVYSYQTVGARTTGFVNDVGTSFTFSAGSRSGSSVLVAASETPADVQVVTTLDAADDSQFSATQWGGAAGYISAEITSGGKSHSVRTETVFYDGADVAGATISVDGSSSGEATTKYTVVAAFGDPADSTAPNRASGQLLIVHDSTSKSSGSVDGFLGFGAPPTDPDDVWTPSAGYIDTKADTDRTIVLDLYSLKVNSAVYKPAEGISVGGYEWTWNQITNATQKSNVSVGQSWAGGGLTVDRASYGDSLVGAADDRYEQFEGYTIDAPGGGDEAWGVTRTQGLQYFYTRSAGSVDESTKLGLDKMFQTTTAERKASANGTNEFKASDVGTVTYRADGAPDSAWDVAFNTWASLGGPYQSKMEVVTKYDALPDTSEGAAPFGPGVTPSTKVTASGSADVGGVISEWRRASGPSRFTTESGRWVNVTSDGQTLATEYTVTGSAPSGGFLRTSATNTGLDSTWVQLSGTVVEKDFDGTPLVTRARGGRTDRAVDVTANTRREEITFGSDGVPTSKRGLELVYNGWASNKGGWETTYHAGKATDMGTYDTGGDWNGGVFVDEQSVDGKLVSGTSNAGFNSNSLGTVWSKRDFDLSTQGSGVTGREWLARTDWSSTKSKVGVLGSVQDGKWVVSNLYPAVDSVAKARLDYTYHRDRQSPLTGGGMTETVDGDGFLARTVYRAGGPTSFTLTDIRDGKYNRTEVRDSSSDVNGEQHTSHYDYNGSGGGHVETKYAVVDGNVQLTSIDENVGSVMNSYMTGLHITPEYWHQSRTLTHYQTSRIVSGVPTLGYGSMLSYGTSTTWRRSQDAPDWAVTTSTMGSPNPYDIGWPQSLAPIQESNFGDVLRIIGGAYEVFAGVSLIGVSEGPWAVITVPAGVISIGLGIDNILTGAANLMYGRVGPGYSVAEAVTFNLTGSESAAVLVPAAVGLLTSGDAYRLVVGGWRLISRRGLSTTARVQSTQAGRRFLCDLAACALRR